MIKTLFIIIKCVIFVELCSLNRATVLADLQFFVSDFGCILDVGFKSY